MYKLLKNFFWFLILIPFSAFSQNDIYSFKQISYEQGLPGVNVRDIFQDSRGVMWISVEAMGVCKYYGNKFVRFRNIQKDSTSLSSNFTNCVIEDPQQNIWVATDFGLNRYDRITNKFTRFIHSESIDSSISDNVVNKLFTDSKGNLWVCTGNGLNKYDPKNNSFTRFLYSPNPNYNNLWNIKDIYEDQNGFLWIGTNKGLLKFDTASNTYKSWNQNYYKILSHDLINSLEGDSEGTLWIGTHRGINKFDLKTEQFLPWRYKNEDIPDLKDEGINHIFFDKEEKTLWVGTYTHGIVKVNPADNTYIRITISDIQQHGLKSNHIKHILKDRSGAMWIATKFEGVFFHDVNKTIFSKWPDRYKLFVDIKDKHTLDFYKDWKYDSTFWVASKFEGLFRIDLKANKIRNYKHNIYKPTTINSNRIQAIERDHFGDLYIGSENGLDLFVERAQEFDHISSIPIDQLKEDNSGNLWIGSDDGVYVFNRSEGIVQRHPSQHDFFKTNYEIRYITTDSRHKVWFATDQNGLFCYDPKTDKLDEFTYDAKVKNGIADNMIRPVMEDSEGNIWIGTKTNGLNRFDPSSKEFVNYTIENGLPTNFILSIEEDRAGNFWIATHNGLSKFDPESHIFTNFNKEYGLQNNIFEIGTSYNFGDGCLMFGGHNGFNIFNTDSIAQNHKVPSLIISSVKVMDAEIERDIVKYAELKLNHKQNYLTFEFGLTDFSNPVKHQFSYKLEGLDDDWSIASNRNYVSYSSLSPKEYTLKIRGANELGIWNNEGISLKIVITPPFYQTWIFKISAFLTLLIIGFTWYRAKTEKNKRMTRLLESKIKERTQKLQNALKELKEQQIKIESQNEELSIQYEKIVHQRDHIQEINHELHTAHEELQQVNSELDKRVKDRTEKLVKANQELDRFVYSASHDLSAPLKSILGLIHIAKLENKEKSLGNNLEYMERSVKKLEEVIKSLTQFSRNMGHEVKRSNILFDEIVEDILNECKVAYDIRDYEVIKDYNTNTLVYSDYLRLRIILTNLISNAFKYKKPEMASPTIKISLLKIDDHYTIKVKDNGMGISKENQKKVFDMFFRATTQSEGSGLGLYIVNETLLKLNGTIELTSEADKFTEFTVNLPLLQ